MKLRTKLLIVVLVGLLGYAFGRYLQPAEVKIKTETKIVEVEKEVEKTKTRTVVKYVKRPDGTEEREEVTEEVTEKESNSTKNKEKTKDKQIVASKPQWRVQVAADLTNFEPANYRVGVERRVFGPIHLGAWSETNFNSFGFSASMEF